MWRLPGGQWQWQEAGPHRGSWAANVATPPRTERAKAWAGGPPWERGLEERGRKGRRKGLSGCVLPLAA